MQTRASVEFKPSDRQISEYFGIDVFGKEQMREYLSKDAFASVMEAIEGGKRIDRKIADQVAAGMKMWAISRGATHYTHWFQPLNESTAEKHDAFLEPLPGGKSFESFSGNVLSQQEPDASSFPSGGIRNTFEARGYSAWDPSSPTFVIDKTLCIPSIFVAYTGEALDFKAPLLRAMAAVDKAAVEVCKLFDKDIDRVITNLGWEQEYFLVDEDLFNSRADLQQTGRTLMGHPAAKDQQLEDHYWGAIPKRVENFMKEFEEQAYKLGIPLKTRHNEVAPNQFECATVYEEANVAADHNILLMTIMNKVAPRHHLKVIFHEKPFQGVNGSGKHCNWSLSTNTGVNLLAPARNPKGNMLFLTFFVCTLMAAEKYGTLLMSSIASATNAHRLGGNEAPPSVLSVFCGSTMTAMMNAIEKSVASKFTPEGKTAIKLNIGKIPEIMLDNTDRNRTSPFAFTGNRFEFRATGSSANCSMPVIVIDTAVAEQLDAFRAEVEKLVGKGMKKDEAILKTIRKFAIASKDIRFEGNGYSEQWLAEAYKRGLKDINCVTEAFKEYLDEKNVALFEKYKVMNRSEITARFEIKEETYLKKIQIESKVLADMAMNHIIPTAIKYQNILIENIRGIKEFFPDKLQEYAGKEMETLARIAELSNIINDTVGRMTDIRHEINRIADIPERAGQYEARIVPFMSELRQSIDELEMIVDDSLWPLTKYRELLAAL